MRSSTGVATVPLLPGCRCILPTLPLGGHRQPMRAGADLTHRGVALLLGELLERLDLSDVTLVLNDWGGGQFLVSEGRAQRVGARGFHHATHLAEATGFEPGRDPAQLWTRSSRARR